MPSWWLADVDIYLKVVANPPGQVLGYPTTETFFVVPQNWESKKKIGPSQQLRRWASLALLTEWKSKRIVGKLMETPVSIFWVTGASGLSDCQNCRTKNIHPPQKIFLGRDFQLASGIASEGYLWNMFLSTIMPFRNTYLLWGSKVP